MLNKKALFGAIAAVVAGVAVVIFMRGAPAPSVGPEAGTPAAITAPFKGPRSQDDARRALMELPELKAWSAHLEKSSSGTVRGALIEYGPTPQVIKDIRYWQISYVENTADAAHRWESFLVGVDTPDILVQDDETDTTLTLAQWRASKNPIARTSAQ